MQRRRGLWWAGLALLALLFLSACATGAPSGEPQPTITGGPRPTGSGSGRPSGPDESAFNSFQAACLKKTSAFFNGRVVWPKTAAMTVNRETTLSAAVTLDPTAAPTALLPGADATAQAVQATCGVKASLTFDSNAFSIPNSAPQYQSLLPSGEAHWDWVVTPKTAGTRQIIIELQPIVLIGSDGTPEDNSPAGAKPFATQVTVAQDPSATARIGRWTDFLTSAKGLVVAITALVVALGGLWAALRKWGRPSKDDDPEKETSPAQ